MVTITSYIKKHTITLYIKKKLTITSTTGYNKLTSNLWIQQ